MIFFLSFSDNKPERGSLEAKGLPDLILNISGIGEMHQLLIIYKDHKGRGLYRYLGNVIQSESLTLIGRRLLHGHSLSHDLIQYTGSHTHGVILTDDVDSLEQLGQSLSWSEEVTRFLFIWSGFLSVSYCSKKCLSIKIEQFVAAFPRRGKALFKVVNHTFELIFFLYMIPFAYSYMMSAIHSGQLSPACGIPMYYIQAAPFVSFLLVTFRILQRWIIEFKVARG